MFDNLKRLTLNDCSVEDLASIKIYTINLSQLEYLHITIRKLNENIDTKFLRRYDASINQFSFDERMCSLHTVSIELNDGLVLNKLLIPNQTLRNVNLILQTIDDLYVLLDGLVPNVQTMIIQLCQSRILTCLRPRSTPPCPQLTEFTLFEPRIGFVIDDLKCILGYMPNLIKLTLSIRDTPDSTFCHGSTFESILNEYVPHLREFHYTMTQRIVNKRVIHHFIRWPMNVVFYENENCQWVHVFSLPWPSNSDDKRRLPIVNSESTISITSDVKRAEYMEHVKITKHNELIELKTHFRRAYQITTCLSIDIKLPSRISKVTLTTQTPMTSINLIAQPFIQHLNVQRRLTDERDISILARQFPHVQYLELLFPLEKSLHNRCLKSLFSLDDNTERKFCFWPSLTNFSTELLFGPLNRFCNDRKFRDWLFQNTDLKYYKYPFHVQLSLTTVSVWL